MTYCATIAAIFLASTALADDVTGARFTAPTTAYDHAILGDDIEYSGLVIDRANAGSILVRHAEGTRVFEDLAPRLWDVTGDGSPEVVVIETDPPRGAQLVIYDASGTKIGATPHIGQTHRWLAPVAAADLDGDGRIEVAFVDRPHLAKVLRIWRWSGGEFHEVAAASGVTNHRIGDAFIQGGLRDCGQGPELILADAAWQDILALRFDGQSISATDLAPYAGPGSMEAALGC